MLFTGATHSTLIHLLQDRAYRQPDRQAYAFGFEEEEQVVTYQELDRRARALGALLQARGATGERVLLLYPPGLAYIVAFFGCLYAGALAVPAYPPRLNGNLGRVQAVIEDAQARFALTTAGIQAGIERRFADAHSLADLQWIATDNLPQELAEDWQMPAVYADTLAFLQYTSGSTSAPKGVMLTHGNLLHNLQLIETNFGTSEASRGVVWLPPYHDMGLIGGILQPLFTGYPMTLMAPVDFIQSPLRWLQTISRTQATVSGGPNFAYDLCVQKITPEQRDQLDLSSWSNAFTGAEPIRAETLERFADFFAPCGFRREAFTPCYGLAEGTLFVAGARQQTLPVVHTFAPGALVQNQVVAAEEAARTLVSSGRVPESGQQIEIVDPETRLICPPDRVGEIWVCGPSVAQGYWRRPDLTEQTFCARLADTEGGPFLRTGDLGFVRDGELFVTGRLKDLIIIRGRNYYPQDIEFCMQESHLALAKGFGAAFSVEVDGEERLVVVQEIERAFRKANHEAVIDAISQSIAEQHQLQAYAVLLIKPASIPKTSSGKIQRHVCRERFLAGTLDVVGSRVLADEWQARQEAAETDAAPREHVVLSRELFDTLTDAEKQATVQAFLLQEAAEVLKVSSARLHPQQPLSTIGLDSIMAVELKNRLEAATAVELPMVMFLEGPSIEQLAAETIASLQELAPLEPGLRPEDLTPERGGYETGTAPLTYGQRALWFLQRVAPENTAYHISHAVRIEGALDVEVLRRAFDVLVQRHAALRTTFANRQGEPLQIVHPQGVASFAVQEVSGLDESALHERINAAAQETFDLEKGPLLRVQLFAPAAEAHVLLLTMHHIIVDFWSLGVLIRELRDVYASLKKGDIPRLTDLPLQFDDYAFRQQAWLQGPQSERLRSYWQKQLAGAPTLLQLPTDRPRPRVASYRGAAYAFQVGPALTQAIKALGQAQEATLYMTLLAAFQVLLHRYTGQEDLLVGSPTAGRNRSQLADLVGYLVNPVVLRADLTEPLSFRQFLQQVRHTVLAALDHQDYPFSLLVEHLQPQRDLSYPPLIQAMFVLQKSHVLHEEGLSALALQDANAKMAGALPMAAYPLQQRAAQFDLTLTVAEHEGGITATFEYATDLFAEATIARMAGHFQTLLAGIVADPDRQVATLPMLTTAEWEQALGQAADVPGAATECLHRLFERQVQRTPHAVAVVYEQERLTYEQLNRKANRLAHRLLAEGVGPDVLVGLCAERSVEMVVGVLAILKSGAAYVPIDPTVPAERFAFLVEDANVPVLVTQTHLREKLPDHRAKVICLGADMDTTMDATLTASDEENPVTHVRADHLAYVIYTSGSTGRPKGVLINHANVVHLFAGTDAWYRFDEHDVWTMFHSYAFDFSVWEFWGALLHGGRLVVVPYLVSRSPQDFYKLLVQEGVTVLNQTPSAFRQLMQAEETLGVSPHLKLRYVIFGGEALELPTLQPWMQRHGDARPQLVNMYGITETTVHVTYRPLTETDVREATGSPIGRPIPGYQVYVLDRHLQPVPFGVPGEMYVSGVGVARGYWNRPELTAERFIRHPFAVAQAASLLYKTGDVARYLPDGSLHYVGRIDHQVKIRGFRIELGEVESILETHPSVREAVVDAQGEPQLVAYVALVRGEALTSTELREYLKEKMPAYMLPSAFVMLDALPLTANGKVDRKALPAPEAGTRLESGTAYVAPRDVLERGVTAIWQAVLGMERVGVHDNFFDLGGHSLSMVKAHGQVQELVGREFSVVEMFRHPTIDLLTKFLNQEQQQKPNAEQLRDHASKQRELMNRQKQMRRDRRR